MENNQISSMQMPQPTPQPDPQSTPQLTQPEPTMQPIPTPMTQPVTPAQPSMNVVQPVDEPRDNSNLIKIIVIVVLSLLSVTFIILFAWKATQYNVVNTDVQGQINSAVSSAVAEAVYNQEQADLERFNEEEKYPYRSFVGPADYGQLSFEYPKTWSVYIESDASKGGDYRAYFNPLEVNPVSTNTINALRVTIRDTAFDTVAAEYQRILEQRDSGLTVESVTVAGTAANRYTGRIPNTELSGVIVIFKIRDKTAILQMDAMPFLDDFNKLLETVQFNA